MKRGFWEMNTHRRAPGQGALEYLLLIGGAVLVTTMVLLIVIGSTGQTTNIINDNLEGFTTDISLHAAFGGGGADLCGTPSEVCGTGTSQACTTGSFSYPGTQSCNATCSGYGSCSTALSCGDGSIDGLEICDTAGDLGCSVDPICNACSVCVPSGGSPPSIVSFTASQDGTTFDLMTLDWTTTGSPTIVGACVAVTDLSSVTGTDEAGFSSSCSSAGGFYVGGYAPSGPVPSAALPKTLFEFVLYAENTFGSDTSYITYTTLPMSNFFAFDWDAMASPKVTGTVIASKDPAKAAGWSFGNTSASGELAITQVTPTFNQPVNLTTLTMNTTAHAGNTVLGSFATDTPIPIGGGGFLIENGTFGSVTNSVAGYSGVVYANGSTQRLAFTFSDGSVFTTPALNTVSLVENPTAALTCDGSGGALNSGTITLAKNLQSGGLDRGYSTTWNLSSVPNGAKILFASLEYFQTANSGGAAPGDPFYFELVAGATPTCTGSLITFNFLTTPTGDLGVPLPANPSTTMAINEWYQFDIESAGTLLPDTKTVNDFTYIQTGKDFSSPAASSYRRFSSVYSATVPDPNKPLFFLGYESP